MLLYAFTSMSQNEGRMAPVHLHLSFFLTCCPIHLLQQMVAAWANKNICNVATTRARHISTLAFFLSIEYMCPPSLLVSSLQLLRSTHNTSSKHGNPGIQTLPVPLCRFPE